MCGIAGYLNSNSSSDKHTMERMLNAMRSRGPDEQNSISVNNVSLGAVRLSIIDPSGGHQPFVDNDGRVTVIQNGEIYNYLELSTQLKAIGYRFSTKCDTETLLYGYREWGIKGLLSRCRGMFSLAIYDKKISTLFLARDRFGIKPLFYFSKRAEFIFASDLRSIIEHPRVPRVLDPNTFANFLSIGYPIGPGTFYSGVKQLAPGSFIEVRNGQVTPPEKFWNLSFPIAGKENSLRKKEALLQLDSILSESINLHQRCDVSYGLFLSGGIDSAVIASLMKRTSTKPFEAFTLAFQEQPYDESIYAEKIAAHFDIPFHKVVAPAPTSEQLETVLGNWDQPNFDYSAIPTYVLSKYASNHVKVVLSGDGGDEIFAGYPTHFLYKISPHYLRLPKVLRKSVIKPLIMRLPAKFDKLSFDYKAKSFVQNIGSTYQQNHYNWKLLFNKKNLKALLKPDIFTSLDIGHPQQIFYQHFEVNKKSHPLNNLLYVDMKTFLVDDCLYKVDRMSMANSLEVRTPLLDHKVVEFMAGIPPSLKLKGLTTKWLLREYLREQIPKPIRKMKKQGFVPPINRWFANQLFNYTQQTILDSYASELFNKKYLQKMLNEHQKQKRDWNRQIGAVLSFCHWYDNNIHQK